MISQVRDNRLKIGFSRDAKKRFRAIQTSSSDDLTCLGTMKGTLKDERALHKKFASIRVRGEWFKNRKHLRNFIAQAAGP